MDPTFEPGSDDSCKRFVLYTLPACPNCKELIMLADEQAPGDVYVQPIDQLSALPSWLDGVPILADKNTMNIYRGTEAFEFMNEYSTLKPPSEGNSQFTSELYSQQQEEIHDSVDDGRSLEDKLDDLKKERAKIATFTAIE